MFFKIDAKGVTPINNPFSSYHNAISPVSQSECRRTNTSSDEDSNLTTEDIFCRGTVRAVDAYLGKGDGGNSGVDLDKVAASHSSLVVLLRTLHGRRSHGGDNGRADAEALTEGLREVTNLADMHRDVWVFRGRRDGELNKDTKTTMSVPGAMGA
jgi:hypothetical protein